MQDVKSESSTNLVKLCFIVLTCIAEDQYANALMSDPHLVFRVHLHRVPMRHRKVTSDQKVTSLICALMGRCFLVCKNWNGWEYNNFQMCIDLMVEFLMTHLTKRLPYEIYLLCVGMSYR